MMGTSAPPGAGHHVARYHWAAVPDVTMQPLLPHSPHLGSLTSDATSGRSTYNLYATLAQGLLQVRKESFHTVIGLRLTKIKKGLAKRALRSDGGRC